jgi:hypothetical protein
MKRIPILLALFCLGLVTASLAVAQGPPPGKGKPDGKGKKTTTTSSTDPSTCKPKISVILMGTFVSGGGTSFSMDVTRSNFHGHDLVGATQTLTVDDKTMFRRNGHAELSDFKAGDRLNVQARACKKQKGAAAGQAPAAAMLAKRVTGHPAKSSDSPDAGSSTTTTTASSTP